MNENKGVFGNWDEGEDMQRGSLVLFVSGVSPLLSSGDTEAQEG